MFLAGIDPVSLIIYGALLVLSLAATYLFKKKIKTGLGNNEPTVLTNRGAYLPFILGRRRTGAVQMWVGKRTVVDGIFYEEGWHLLSVGPGARLHRIRQGGKIIFEGPIDPGTHPSGTNVVIGGEGNFDIYWGELDQPINTVLGDAKRLGVSSRWPYVMYIHWRKKKLGFVAQWPVLEYDEEVRNFDTGLNASKPWFFATKQPIPEQSIVYSVVNGAAPGTAKITIFGSKKNIYTPGKFLKLSDNVAAGDYQILSSNGVQITYVDPVLGVQIVGGTKIILLDAMLNANAAGYTQIMKEDENDGINHAHALWQILFSEFPHGIGMDPALFDKDALELVGQTVQTEGLLGSIYATDGEYAESIIGAIMQDIGLFLPTDNGKLRFTLIRDPGDPGLLPVISNDLLLAPLVEIESLLEDPPASKLIFLFHDRGQNYEQNGVPIDDDGQVQDLNVSKPTELQILTVVDLSSASKIAERRSQEVLGGSYGKLSIRANRGLRKMLPGRAFTITNFPGVYRATKVTSWPLSGRVDIEAVHDFYGAPIVDYNIDPGSPPPDTTFEPGVDLAATIVEVPAYKTPAGEQRIIIPRIRSSPIVGAADLWISGDGNTFTNKGEDTGIVTGGRLTAQMNAGGMYNMTQGPTILGLGPDISSVLDLTGDPQSWRGGRQWCVIDKEICFLNKITALGNNQYRLDGLLRARFDTESVVHVIASNVFIFRYDDLLKISDLLLLPNKTIYAKTQPKAPQAVDLSLIIAVSQLLQGKGIAPMKPTHLKSSNMGAHWVAGQPLDLVWGYRSTAFPKTGAGQQGAGGPTSVSPFQGTFTLKFKTTGGVVKRTVTGLAATSYSYSNANIVSDFGGSAPASMLVEITQVNSGYSSPPLENTFVKV